MRNTLVTGILICLAVGAIIELAGTSSGADYLPPEGWAIAKQGKG